MNNLQEEFSLSEKELIEFIDDVIEEHDKWNINISSTIEKLSEQNKIFLNDIIEIFGEKVLYIIYGYLTYPSLLEYDYVCDGGIQNLINEFDEIETLNFIDLLVDFKKYDLEYSIEEIDFNQIVKKLKREVYELKKKLKQPKVVINTNEFTERYGFSQAQQKGLRGKLRDPLPYICTNGKTIHYKTEEVEKWLENYNISK